MNGRAKERTQKQDTNGPGRFLELYSLSIDFLINGIGPLLRLQLLSQPRFSILYRLILRRG